MVPVVVAAADMTAGTQITDPVTMLAIKFFPEDAKPPNCYSHPEDLRNQVLARDVDKNVPITSRDLSLAKTLFKSVPPGLRAISVRVSFEHSGMLLPGARVDVIGKAVDAENADKLVTKVIVENALVLALNVMREALKQSDGVISNPVTITLAVAPQDVEPLVAAQARGVLTVALRRPVE